MMLLLMMCSGAEASEQQSHVENICFAARDSELGEGLQYCAGDTIWVEGRTIWARDVNTKKESNLAQAWNRSSGTTS